MDFNIKNMEQELKDLNGNTLKENNKPVTLLMVCQNALLANIPNENIDGVEKIARYELAKKLADNPKLTSEDKAKLKELIGKTMSTIVVGQVMEMIENLK